MTMSLHGLAKLLEECGEVQQVIGKVLAYGLGPHPDGTESLKQRLEEEIADVFAAAHFVEKTLRLDRVAITIRAGEKYQLFEKWHKDPDNAPKGLEELDARVSSSTGKK